MSIFNKKRKQSDTSDKTVTLTDAESQLLQMSINAILPYIEEDEELMKRLEPLYEKLLTTNEFDKTQLNEIYLILNRSEVIAEFELGGDRFLRSKLVH